MVLYKYLNLRHDIVLLNNNYSSAISAIMPLSWTGCLKHGSRSIVRARSTWRKDYKRKFRKSKVILLLPHTNEKVKELHILQGIFSNDSQVFPEINSRITTAFSIRNGKTIIKRKKKTWVS